MKDLFHHLHATGPQCERHACSCVTCNIHNTHWPWGAYLEPDCNSWWEEPETLLERVVWWDMLLSSAHRGKSFTKLPTMSTHEFGIFWGLRVIKIFYHANYVSFFNTTFVHSFYLIICTDKFCNILLNHGPFRFQRSHGPMPPRSTLIVVHINPFPKSIALLLICRVRIPRDGHDIPHQLALFLKDIFFPFGWTCKSTATTTATTSIPWTP